MELIIALMFFAIISAMCLQIFAKSNSISAEAKQMNTYVNILQNIYAVLKYDSFTVMDKAVLYSDDSAKIVNTKNKYKIEIEKNEKGNYKISVYNAEDKSSIITQEFVLHKAITAEKGNE